jgi:hypothetical protein
MARFSYNHPKVEVPNRHWNGCLLVNTLCPDDLCWLPLNEDGSQHKAHCLGSSPWDERLHLHVRDVMFMSTESTTPEELIHEGWLVQIRICPGDREFRRQTNPETVEEAMSADPSRWPNYPIQY